MAYFPPKGQTFSIRPPVLAPGTKNTVPAVSGRPDCPFAAYVLYPMRRMFTSDYMLTYMWRIGGSFAREVFGRLGKNYGGIFFGEEFLLLGFPKSGSALPDSGSDCGWLQRVTLVTFWLRCCSTPVDAGKHHRSSEVPRQPRSDCQRPGELCRGRHSRRGLTGYERNRLVEGELRGNVRF